MGVSPESPIVVLDSGLGGLTVVRALRAVLPHDDILYFGDTARLPYGSKSAATVTTFVRQIITYLRPHRPKHVVIACNTATALALPELRGEFAGLSVSGVVEPGARAAVAASRTRRIGVIGTVGTIKSGAYERAIRALSPDVSILARACPLFVPLVEEGWIDHEATRLVAREYLAPFVDAEIDTLVLGCTHYPLLAPLLGELLGPDVRLIDSAAETAAEAARTLGTERMLAGGDEPTYRFVASDDPLMFLQLGQRFLGGAIEGVEIRTLG